MATPEEHAARREWDDFDPFVDHLVLLSLDPAIADPLDRVVGAYRLLPDERRAQRARLLRRRPSTTSRRSPSAGGRASSSAGPASPPTIAAARAMHLLWNGLASYVLERRIELLFGVASFRGTDPAPLAEALAFLHHEHLAPPDLRVRARSEHYLDMNLMPRDAIDSVRALRVIPPLIKAYLRLGGFVGDGAFVDRDFNTIDVCVVMDTARMTERYLHFYQRGRGRARREGRLERGRAAASCRR